MLVKSHVRGASLPTRDARLLMQINQGFSETWWEHYHELIRRRQESLLSAADLRELIRLTDQIEKREAKRLQALVKLAKLRNVPLRSLMKDLGLPGATDA
jgi:IS4 transposase